jgi:hypothetical protein
MQVFAQGDQPAAAPSLLNGLEALAICWIVLRPLIASKATLALNSGLWVRRLLNSFGEGFAYGGSPFQGRYAASEVNDGDCPEKPDHLRHQGAHRQGVREC